MKKDLFFILILIVKKGNELKENQKASMCFHWCLCLLSRNQVSDKEIDDYFNSRQKYRYVWPPSVKILDKEKHSKNIKQFETKFLIKKMFLVTYRIGQGWRLLPDEIEFLG